MYDMIFLSLQTEKLENKYIHILFGIVLLTVTVVNKENNHPLYFDGHV